MERDELSAWLRLVEAPGVGRESARKLLAAFGSPEAVWTASASARAAVLDRSTQLFDESAPLADERLERCWAWLHQADDGPRHIVPLGDPRYPAALLETSDPPLLLYATGHIELLTAPSLAVVGSRNPTAQGVDNARAFACALGQAGLTIVSGLALGIDAAAHEGGLTGSGSTIAVVGTGLDRVYPRQHHALAKRIAVEGLLLSELPLGSPPLAAHFPQRNRIIAGLCAGTLVVEAATQSGSLITARLAAEAGREVFAIPGSIHNPQSHGCHALIKQGAKLVETAEDILEELQLHTPHPHASERSTDDPRSDPADQDPVLSALGHDPASLDALMARSGWPADQLSARLLALELDGVVARLPGHLFVRRPCA